jgi:hypothetical protein
MTFMPFVKTNRIFFAQERTMICPKAYQDLRAGLIRVEEEINIAPDVMTEI